MIVLALADAALFFCVGVMLMFILMMRSLIARDREIARLNSLLGAKQITDTGYVPEDVVVRLATDAGFRLGGRSEVNANAKDTKDYPQGVWSLPPTFAEKDANHAKYAAIGESDRMTLKLVKP